MNTNKPIIQQDPADWEAGWDAAVDGLPQYPPPPGVTDLWAFCSGWLEGNANLKLAQKIVRLPASKRRIIDSLLWS